MAKTEKSKAPKVTPYDKGTRDFFRGSAGWVKKPWENFTPAKSKGSIGFRRGAR